MNRRQFLSVTSATALTLSAGLVAPKVALADALADVTARGTLRVAVPQDYPPFGSVGSDMAPQGYDIDVATLIAKSLGVKVELVPVSSANRIPYLQTNKVDLIISTLGKTPEREKVLDFSVPYAPYFLGVYGVPEVAVTKPEDLAGKTVGVTRGALEELELAKVAPSTVDYKRYDDNNGTLSAFLSGQVSLISIGNNIAATILAKNPAHRPELKFLLKKSPCYVGLNKGEQGLLDKVNAIISGAIKDGTMNAICQKWLLAPLPTDL